jgi:hypothetical protein
MDEVFTNTNPDGMFAKRRTGVLREGEACAIDVASYKRLRRSFAIPGDCQRPSLSPF